MTFGLAEHAPGTIANVALGTHERNSPLAIHDLNDQPCAAATPAGVGACFVAATVLQGLETPNAARQ
ncbi:MAG TPA: hypothetical protein VN901_20900 [Candidatus Acidoferrales bacterium]|nr:hypothetical protein [Candidatus Acidoferrales bacterium]